MSVFHICIDMQISGRTMCWAQGGTWDGMKANVQKLINILEPENIPTLYVAVVFGVRQKTFLGNLAALRQNPNFGTAFINSTLMIDFPLADQGLIAVKNQPSIKSVAGIDAFLKQNNVDTIILSGWSEGNAQHPQGHCLGESARDLRADGYDVLIAAEATNGAYPSFSYEPEDVVFQNRQQAFAEKGVHVCRIADIAERLHAKRAATLSRTGQYTLAMTCT